MVNLSNRNYSRAATAWGGDTTSLGLVASDEAGDRALGNAIFSKEGASGLP